MEMKITKQTGKRILSYQYESSCGRPHCVWQNQINSKRSRLLASQIMLSGWNVMEHFQLIRVFCCGWCGWCCSCCCLLAGKVVYGVHWTQGKVNWLQSTLMTSTICTTKNVNTTNLVLDFLELHTYLNEHVILVDTPGSPMKRKI